MRTQCHTDTDIYTPQTPHRGALKSGFEKGNRSDLCAESLNAITATGLQDRVFHDDFQAPLDGRDRKM